jgi:hypothetical protein
MTGATIEAALESWASSLGDVKSRMRGLFTQERVATSANLFLDGKLSDEHARRVGCALGIAVIDDCSPSAPMRQIEGLHEGRISGSS